MIIHPVLEPKIVTDYDITFDNGLFTTISVCESDGDTIDQDTTPLAILFYLAPKPSVADPAVKLPAENVTIFLSQVVMLSHRQREVFPANPDQQQNLKGLFKNAHPTVQ